MSNLSVEALRATQRRIADHIVRTPLLRSPVLSDRLGTDIWLKAENLQASGSFKLRGATNTVSLLAEEGATGVIAASAGNHGRAVAQAARSAGIASTVVMPRWASPQKVRNTERLGGRVILAGDSVEAATSAARRIAQDERLAFVHPYDDWRVIAGQATLGLELIDEITADWILTPVGGGGLAAGILAAVGDHVRVVGVRANDAATLPDGIRVKSPGGLPATLLGRLAATVQVDDSAVAQAMTFLLEEHALLAEGAGAAPVAALLTGGLAIPSGATVVAIVSGGNVDLSLLEKAVDFGLAATGRLGLLRLRIDDRPGGLAERLAIIGDLGGNIRTVDHQRGEIGVPPGVAIALVTVETKNSDHLTAIRQAAGDVQSA